MFISCVSTKQLRQSWYINFRIYMFRPFLFSSGTYEYQKTTQKSTKAFERFLHIFFQLKEIPKTVTGEPCPITAKRYFVGRQIIHAYLKCPE